ncbi:DUF1656 domain-containing protein [Xanthobacter sp. V3C-3]|uniref:DUF1656 domain-containing protein n=1 Tax=Xanthobacter lutulentifluminis TaxID=3119935 RepID=UPI00372BE273
MIAEVDILGVYLPIFLVVSLLALVSTRLEARLLSSVGADRFIWHPALFHLSVFTVLAGATFYLLEWLAG